MRAGKGKTPIRLFRFGTMVPLEDDNNVDGPEERSRTLKNKEH